MDEAGGLKHMNATITKIAARTLLVGGVFALATLAAFMRTGAPGITFALESGLNLTIGSQAFYNGAPVLGSTWSLKDLVPGTDKFFDLAGVMPGDSGRARIDMRISGREAGWLCLDFKNLVSDENGFIEPESGEDVNGSASGELADGVEFFAWRDDGDGVFEIGEQPLFGTTTQKASVVLKDKTYTIADSATGAALLEATRAIGIVWCAGDLLVNVPTAQISCSAGALGNAAQTDSLSVDVAIRAVSERESPIFSCLSGSLGRDRGERGNRDTRDERPVRPERPTR